MRGHHIARMTSLSAGDPWGVEMPAVEQPGPIARLDSQGHKASSNGRKGSLILRSGLFRVLSEAGRVVHVSAPPGSGKTVLLRSWITETGLAESAAWVSIEREKRHPQAFWLSVADSLRGTRPARNSCET